MNKVDSKNVHKDILEYCRSVKDRIRQRIYTLVQGQQEKILVVATAKRIKPTGEGSQKLMDTACRVFVILVLMILVNFASGTKCMSES